MIQRLVLPESIQQLSEQPAYRILALSGGGYRGLFTAEVLARIESELGVKKLGDRFSLLSGTSVGALIAVGLALGRSAREVRDCIRFHGPTIFDSRITIGGWKSPIRKPAGPKGGIFGSKYSREPLLAAIDSILGPENRTLTVSQLPKPVILTATCVTTMAPVVISNLESSDSNLSGISLRAALLASCAAPGYFPAVDFETRSLVDGGLVANAPDMIAITETIDKRNAALESCWVLSVGTAPRNPDQIPSRIGRRGLFSWLLGNLVPTILYAQERLIVRQAAILLGDRFLRIDTFPSPDQAAVLQLDDANEDTTRTLLLLADNALTNLPRSRLVAWLGTTD